MISNNELLIRYYKPMYTYRHSPKFNDNLDARWRELNHWN